MGLAEGPVSQALFGDRWLDPLPTCAPAPSPRPLESFDSDDRGEGLRIGDWTTVAVRPVAAQRCAGNGRHAEIADTNLL